MIADPAETSPKIRSSIKRKFKPTKAERSSSGKGVGRQHHHTGKKRQILSPVSAQRKVIGSDRKPVKRKEQKDNGDTEGQTVAFRGRGGKNEGDGSSDSSSPPRHKSGKVRRGTTDAYPSMPLPKNGKRTKVIKLRHEEDDREHEENLRARESGRHIRPFRETESSGDEVELAIDRSKVHQECAGLAFTDICSIDTEFMVIMEIIKVSSAGAHSFQCFTHPDRTLRNTYMMKQRRMPTI